MYKWNFSLKKKIYSRYFCSKMWRQKDIKTLSHRQFQSMLLPILAFSLNTGTENTFENYFTAANLITQAQLTIYTYVKTQTALSGKESTPHLSMASNGTIHVPESSWNWHILPFRQILLRCDYLCINSRHWPIVFSCWSYECSTVTN